MFDNPRERLHWLEEELLSDEPEDRIEDEDDFDEEWEEDEDELGPGYNYAVDFGRTVYDDEEYDEDMVCVEAPKKKGTGGLKFLLLLEIIGILAVIGWWLRWLI